MPDPVELTGRPASPGIAAGPLFRLAAEISHRLPSADVEEERAALRTAVAQSARQIEALIGTADQTASEILEFQAVMLSDDELIAPALTAIEAGGTAEAAWLGAIGAQIDGFEASSNEYFRGRASDLMDLRDRVLRNLAGVDLASAPRGAVLIGEDLTPSRFLETDWSQGGGVALVRGSATSHVAMLARSRGVPMVVALGSIAIDGHAEALLDGESGQVILSSRAAERARFQDRRAALAAFDARAATYLRAPACTADGTAITVMINVANPSDLDRIDPVTCDGVGLMRSEFLFTGPTLPDEEAQYSAYARVLDWADGRPVTICTIDAGGDKPVKGLTVEEQNPFLGLRGIRLSLTRPEIFRVQLRALARAAVHGALKVMLPMVTVPGEIAAARQHLDAALAELAQEGAATARPQLGIMVEVPAVAIVPEAYAEADFFSIGSNDLTQYVTAAARDSVHVADLNDASNPAVMRLIENVASLGARSGQEVSICGDAAGDPSLVPMLIRAGLRRLSVAPTRLAAVKAAIAELRLDG